MVVGGHRDNVGAIQQVSIVPTPKWLPKDGHRLPGRQVEEDGVRGVPRDGTRGGGLKSPPRVLHVVHEPPVDVNVEGAVRLCDPGGSVGAGVFPGKVPNRSFGEIAYLGW